MSAFFKSPLSLKYVIAVVISQLPDFLPLPLCTKWNHVLGAESEAPFLSAVKRRRISDGPLTTLAAATQGTRHIERPHVFFLVLLLEYALIPIFVGR